MSNLDRIKESLDAIDMTKEFDAEIVLIEDGKSNDYYKSTKYENRDGVIITFKLAKPIGEIESWDEFFNVPDDIVGIFNPKSKLGLFKAKYGKTPEVNQKVKGHFNDDGFIRVVL